MPYYLRGTFSAEDHEVPNSRHFQKPTIRTIYDFEQLANKTYLMQIFLEINSLCEIALEAPFKLLMKINVQYMTGRN
jgi:hypothetical protein